MTLNQQIKSDIKEAMRNKQKERRDTLRNIQAVVKQIEVDERRELTDADMESILIKYAKQREDAIAQFKEAGRDDLVAKEEAELIIIKAYLPEQLEDSELEKILKEIIASTGAISMKDMGKVMGQAKKTIGSKADGGRINVCVKRLLE
ncbi:MAG TPA: GatB/YqeY domain-containing protein [Sulfurovum sp.]|nr:GatB/YqeY domain-containing protein [Sulfurovum sp.]